MSADEPPLARNQTRTSVALEFVERRQPRIGPRTRVPKAARPRGGRGPVSLGGVGFLVRFPAAASLYEFQREQGNASKRLRRCASRASTR